jgi:hypothetical protein
MVVSISRPVFRRLSPLVEAILLVLAGSLLLWMAPPIHAQSATAALSGIVMDEHDAVITGVRITVLNLNTAWQRQTRTDGDGYFVIPLLPPGRYNLIALRDGFATMEIRDLELNVNDQLAVKMQLKVSAVGDSVTIIEDGAGVQNSAALGAVISRRLIENLPLNGRSFQSLFELIPGTTLTKTNFNDQGQFSVNGQRANANYFMVDGVSANIGVTAGLAPGQAGGSLPALTVLGGTNNLVSLEALEEFRIQTSSFAPEFGRTAGAQVSIITRSGTNEHRGTVFSYQRHEALDANDWFANRQGFNRSSLRQNDLGGVLGGRLVKDRTFYFLSYEGLRLNQPRIVATHVPSLDLRQKAPWQIRPILNAFPLPNGPDLGNGFAQFTASYSDPSALNAASLRLDQIVNQKITLFGRFNYAYSRTDQRGGGDIPGFNSQSLNTVGHTYLQTATLTVGTTATLTSNLINDLRFNVSRSVGSTYFALDYFGGARPLYAGDADSELSPYSSYGLQIIFRGGANSSIGMGGTGINWQRQGNVVDTLSIVTGPHQIKLGGDYRWLAPLYAPVRYSQSVIYGNSDSTGPTGVQIAATTATAREVQTTVNANSWPPRFINLSAFVQDTWQVTPKLTLTYGLRWDLNPPPSITTNLSLNPPLTVTGLDDPATMTLAPSGTSLWKTTNRNLAPRIGVAYHFLPKRGTVFRGGFGLFYDLGNHQAAQAFGNVYPYTTTQRQENVSFPFGVVPVQFTPMTPNPPYGPIHAFDQNLKLPYTVQWNLTLEQPLGSSQTLSASYASALGRRLLQKETWVSSYPRLESSLILNPNFTTLFVTNNDAASDYHALQIRFQRRLSRGLQSQAAYTWSHSIDNASSDSFGNLRLGRTLIEQGRGPSDFDLRHSLTVAATYNLPTLARGSVIGAVLRNWSVDTILRMRSATPVNVVLGRDPLDLGLRNLIRPDLRPGAPLYLDDRSAPGGRRIDRSAFWIPAQLGPDTLQGTLGRNALRGFRASQIDLALRRQFHLTERFLIQVRGEAFNLFNQPNFGDPIGDLSSPFFGQSTQMFGRSLGTGGVNGGLSPLYQVGGSRSIQLVLRLQF